MPISSLKKSADEKLGHSGPLGELDRVKLKTAVRDKGRMLEAGLEGTVVLCHGAEAYEVEFDMIGTDFFQISAKDLEKS